MRASTRWDVAAMLLAVAVYAGCGDDADDDPRSRDAAVSDAADSGGAEAGGAGRRSGSGGAGGRSAAGSGSAGRAGAGGAGTGGRQAAPMNWPPPMRDERGCPSLEFPGLFVLPSCCTSRGMCGIDASMFGGAGCLDLATAAERARMAGASAPFPAPRACDDLDAGMHDDAGM